MKKYLLSFTLGILLLLGCWQSPKYFDLSQNDSFIIETNYLEKDKNKLGASVKDRGVSKWNLDFNSKKAVLTLINNESSRKVKGLGQDVSSNSGEDPFTGKELKFSKKNEKWNWVNSEEFDETHRSFSDHLVKKIHQVKFNEIFKLISTNNLKIGDELRINSGKEMKVFASHFIPENINDLSGQIVIELLEENDDNRIFKFNKFLLSGSVKRDNFKNEVDFSDLKSNSIDISSALESLDEYVDMNENYFEFEYRGEEGKIIHSKNKLFYELEGTYTNSMNVKMKKTGFMAQLMKGFIDSEFEGDFDYAIEIRKK